MIEIINSDLNSVEIKKLFHKITSEEMELTSGGITFLPLLLSSNRQPIQLTTFSDGVNDSTTVYHSPFGVYDNKFLTVDFSKTTLYVVI